MSDRKNTPGVTRAAILDLIRKEPQTTENLAVALGRGRQAMWLAVRDMRRNGDPVTIDRWVTPLSGKGLIPAYRYGWGEDADREDFEYRRKAPKVPARRDLAAIAMFGERGMAGNGIGGGV